MELMIKLVPCATACVIQKAHVCLQRMASIALLGLWNALEGWACGEEGTV